MTRASVVCAILIAGPAFAQTETDRVTVLMGETGASSGWTRGTAYCSGFLSVLEVEDAALQTLLTEAVPDFLERASGFDGASRSEAIAARTAEHWQTMPDSPQARIDMGLLLRHCLSIASDPQLRGTPEFRIR
ncbi:hypothetical protein [Jannaschia pohangensis]|uniref:FAD:protein FMN transferase n=1 Tax=Jannaschia pohangensis TaxID=390807 RepID=A0A1I3I3P5_9RHOB|nr:hypothetical protein [Jannaschia pohangensis]SFI42413.1 hypothetical protein SAMN04488095_0801 [Jannaschia pohangensis]